MRAIRCWRCEKDQAPAFFCGSCGAVQGLSADADYFALLGLPSHPDVDEKIVSERYYELSRKLHPDRFQTASPRELSESVRATALLNRAFQTLRDLEGRGRYWLERTGDKLSRDNNRVPPELAAFVFDVQESLSDLADSTEADRAAKRTALSDNAAEVGDRRDRGRAALSQLLRDWPADGSAVGASGGDGQGRGSNGAAGAVDLAARRATLKELLSELSYLRTLDRDVRAALEE